MTRIIAGAARGIRLDVPAAGTRPTSDRVRESLFAALESADAIAGARVLDLYAGTGALGLEALSRGASSADLVEHAAGAAQVARANAARVAKAAASTPARVHRASVTSFVRGGAGPYDLVFADPPYDLADEAIGVVLAGCVTLMAEDGLFVLERAARDGLPPLPGRLVLDREKRYGDTGVWWLRRR
ncbi:16S rRNA (guanine(966)-N(2))-methyltransferase RsmD [Microbacterium luticocti]|uniref:16S rRNA (guanine(966)-N(2))-methyltransferase RsmD n=1 Tax=Microbacterium luticocti TaxID=451764 RepID=UPI0003FD121B|nr:16S rRNA (guanine(966)-N(2))-methyltransferase RsmD [Microbacterium luticocti]